MKIFARSDTTLYSSHLGHESHGPCHLRNDSGVWLEFTFNKTSSYLLSGFQHWLCPLSSHLLSNPSRSTWGALTAGASGASCISTTLHLGNSFLQPLCFNTGLSGQALQRMCQVYPESNSHFCSYFLLASAGYQQFSVSYQKGEDGQVLRHRKCLSDNFSGESQGRKSSHCRVGSIQCLETNLPFKTTYSSQPDQETEQT